MKIRNLHNINNESHIKHSHENLINVSLNNVNYKYSGSNKNILNNISMKVTKGSWNTILGPNGSGKSTLIKLLARINKIKNGEIKINNIDIYNYKNKDFAKNVSYIPQIIEIPDGILVYDFVALGRNPYSNFIGNLSKNDKEKIKSSMIETNVWEFKDTMVNNLSGGQRQSVLLAMILAQDTDIILLDEPTTYLDIRNQYELLELLDKLHHNGKTIIAILHDINQAVQYSDCIHIMKDGQIVKSGHPSKIITEELLVNVYGIKTKLHKNGNYKFITSVKIVGNK